MGKRFDVPTSAYVELPRQTRLPVSVKEIQASGMWLETSEPLPLEFRANLRIVFPSTEGALGFNVEVVCRGQNGIGIELSKSADAITRSVILAWSKGQVAELPGLPPPVVRVPESSQDITEDLPRVARRDPSVARHIRETVRTPKSGVPLRYKLDGTEVLVIEDDAGCAKFLQTGLARLGGTVWIAKNGSTGIELAREKRIDAVLLDWMLPVVSGEKVLAELQRDTPSLPIAVVSGVVQSGAMRARVRQLGAAEVFAKPFELRHISDWLIRTVHLAREGHALK